MLKQTKIAFLVGTLLAGAAFANTATTLVVNEPIAREAGERRGEGAGHPAIEVKDQLARRGRDDRAGDDRGGRGEGAGHPAIEVQDQLARNGADDRQPDDRGGRRGGRGGRA